MGRYLSKILLFVLTCSVIFVLTGCSQTEKSGSSDLSGNEQGQSVPSVETKFTNKNQVEQLTDGQWSMKDNSFTHQYGGSLITIGTDNQVKQELSLNKSEFPFVFSWNDERVFVAGSPQSPTTPCRVMKRGEEYVIVNAEIYDRAGKLLHTFPTEDRKGIESSMEKFEASNSLNVEKVLWIDNDHLVINQRCRIFVYSLSEDKVTLLEDWTEMVNKAWSAGNSLEYGSYNAWAYEGILYYTVRDEYPKLPSGVKLYRFPMSGDKEELFKNESYDNFTISNNILQAVRYGEKGLECYYTPLHTDAANMKLIKTGQNDGAKYLNVNEEYLFCNISKEQPNTFDAYYIDLASGKENTVFIDGNTLIEDKVSDISLYTVLNGTDGVANLIFSAAIQDEGDPSAMSPTDRWVLYRYHTQNKTIEKITLPKDTASFDISYDNIPKGIAVAFFMIDDLSYMEIFSLQS